VVGAPVTIETSQTLYKLKEKLPKKKEEVEVAKNLNRASRTSLDQYQDEYQPIRSRKWMLDFGAVPDLSEATDMK
jgi:hypothetical protein